MKQRNFYIIMMMTSILFSCNQGKEKKTPSGMKYVVYRELNGKKPMAGDWVTVSMVYLNDDDSVLFDSRNLGKPLRFELPVSKFAGSFEEGLMMLGEGDSASFYINADSMYEHVISKQEGEMKTRPKPGSNLRFDVALLRVQPFKEAEMELAMEESRQEQAERKTLDAWMKEKNIEAQKQTEGYYIVMQSAGKGAQVKKGDKVSVKFTGRFLNGIIFDSNAESGKPYNFTVGDNEVIKGWDLAVQRLRTGDKVTLIIPSALGYGKEGIRRGNSMKYFIPPYSTLVFDFEVLDIMPLSAKK